MFTYSSYYYLIFLVDQAPNRMPFTLIQNLSKFIFKKIFILKLFFGLQLLPINVFILSYVFLQPCPMTFKLFYELTPHEGKTKLCALREDGANDLPLQKKDVIRAARMAGADVIHEACAWPNKVNIIRVARVCRAVCFKTFIHG